MKQLAGGAYRARLQSAAGRAAVLVGDAAARAAARTVDFEHLILQAVFSR